MNHSFSKSHFHTNCAVCNNSEISHGPDAKCEVCDITPTTVESVNNILMCPSCESKEMDARLNIINAPRQSIDNVLSDAWSCSCGTINNILNARCTKCKIERPHEFNTLHKLDNLVLTTAKQIDQSINYRTDLFNAETVSIESLRLAIESDNTIENKHFELARIIKERHEHFQSVIFAKQDEIMEASNRQKAIQIYLNNLANKLRSEEREKLKLSDITYQVKPVGPVKTPSIKKPSKKFDSASIKLWAANLTKELGKPIPEFMLQTIAVSNNCDAEAAANILRRNIKESLSMNQ